MKQLTVLGSNRKGLLAEVTEHLSNHNIDIRSFDTLMDGDQVYIKLVVSDYNQALSVLTESGYQAISEESVLLRLEDQPGALARIARSLADQEIDIRAITLVNQGSEHCAVAISSNDNERVRELFAATLIN